MRKKNPHDKVVTGSYPIDKIEYYNHTIRIFPATNTKLSDFVDLQIFSKFKPNTNHFVASKLYGQPTYIKEQFEDYIYEYWTDSSRIELWESTDDSHATILVAIPKDCKLSQIAISQIQELINNDWYSVHPSENPSIMIMDKNDNIAVTIRIINNQVSEIQWSTEF